MNERIKELALHAGLPTALDYHQKRYEKFAELIIRECGQVAWQYTPNTEECEYTWLIRDKIREHFGVEE